MNSREKIKDAYEKLRCFDNPLLHDIADDLEQSYSTIFGKGINEIVNDVALQENVKVNHIISNKRDEHLVYCRYLVAKQAIGDYSLEKIANALGRTDHSTVIHYLEDYNPPTKFTQS